MYFLDTNLSGMDVLLKVIVPLLIAFVVGAFVGLERQNVGKAAGLSSHILVAVASAGIAIMQRLMFEHQVFLQSTGVDIDPEQQRVIAQVVTGIGFIGAGVILKDQAQVIRGITTAATLWFTAMTGLILGSGYVIIGSILGAFIIIFILMRDFKRGFNPLIPKEKRERPNHSIQE